MLKSVFGSIRGRAPGDFRWSSHGVFRNHFRWLTVGCLTCNSSNMGAKNVSNSVLRVGQFVAYHGDRADGMRELLDAGVDILTGDYLAELTMLVLRKNQLRGGPGYAAAFVEQLEQFLPQIAKDGVKVVTNAGGLDPAACAAAVRDACARRGVELSVAWIEGDDLREDLSTILGPEGTLRNFDTGDDLSLEDTEILTANAYLGAWPIVSALEAGADIVICPRVADASLVVGPSAWHFGWRPDDFDMLAGGVVAGHLIECCAQVTGGQFALFHEFPDLGLPGLPIAEIRADASAVITKPVGSGGTVNTDTVTAQLLYEIGGTEYLNPDVTVDLTSVRVQQDGVDRVLVSGTRGRAPNDTTKLSLTFEGGYRNTLTVGLTGMHVAEKLAWLRREVESAVGKPETFEAFRWTVVGPAAEVDGDQEQVSAWVVITARDKNRAKVSRAGFADRIVQLGISNIPGFYMTTPPQRERLFGVQWPCLIGKKHVDTRVRIGDERQIDVSWQVWPVDEPASAPAASIASASSVNDGETATVRVPLGEVVGTRSGDKGGTANLGVWARSADAYSWLSEHLTVDRLRELIPESAELKVERFEFPNVNGLNFVLFGYLEKGVSSCTRIDPQAKGLGEYLASRRVDVPVALVPNLSGASSVMEVMR